MWSHYWVTMRTVQCEVRAVLSDSVSITDGLVGKWCSFIPQVGSLTMSHSLHWRLSLRVMSVWTWWASIPHSIINSESAFCATATFSAHTKWWQGPVRLRITGGNRFPSPCLKWCMELHSGWEILVPRCSWHVFCWVDCAIVPHPNLVPRLILGALLRCLNAAEISGYLSYYSRQ